MLYNVRDISFGSEQIPVEAKNRYTFDAIPPFKYINGIEITSDLLNVFNRKIGCNCKGTCDKNKCNCCRESGEFYIEFCDPNFCLCSYSACGHRMNDTLKLKIPLQIFFVNPGKRWGVRCENDIVKGQLLFEYAGILEEDSDCHPENDYIFLFEHEDKGYLINAHEKGNVTRFLNHACLPNMQPILVIGDGNIPHIVFVALRDIARGEELTFNYGPQWWSSRTSMNCVCGSPYCEYQRDVIVLK